tara:strand:+ start:536 stop:643 length:108 start_codon:yes stop_codon:yes gene_type:complete
MKFLKGKIILNKKSNLKRVQGGIRIILDNGNLLEF